MVGGRWSGQAVSVAPKMGRSVAIGDLALVLAHWHEAVFAAGAYVEWDGPGSCGAAVDADVLGGDPARSVAGQKHHHRGNLIRPPQPAERAHGLQAG